MKKLIIIFVVGLFSLGTVSASSCAGDHGNKDHGKITGKKVTLTGTVICGHCDMDAAKKCHKAIETSDGKQYLLKGKSVKKFFKANNEVEEVAVTGYRIAGQPAFSVKSIKASK